MNAQNTIQSELVMGMANAGRGCPFVEREADGTNDETKEACRQRVADFLLRHHSDAGRLKLLSFPSIHWSFERIIEQRRAERTKTKCLFVGIERDITIVRRAMPWMPGRNPCWFDRGFRQMTFGGARTDRAWMIHMEAEQFTRLGQRGFLDERDKAIWNGYRHWTCVWLDFTAQLSRPVELVLPKIGAGCEKRTEDVPVAVTILKGREAGDVTGRLAAFDGPREDYLAALLNSGRHRRFEMTDTFDYVSSRGSAMLTVMGVLKMKPLDPPHDAHEPPVYVDDNGRISRGTRATVGV